MCRLLKVKYDQHQDAAAEAEAAAAAHAAAAVGPLRPGQRFTFSSDGEPLGLAGGPAGVLRGSFLPQRRRRDERGLDKKEEVRHTAGQAAGWLAALPAAALLV